jgi:hypothetical protein
VAPSGRIAVMRSAFFVSIKPGEIELAWPSAGDFATASEANESKQRVQEIRRVSWLRRHSESPFHYSTCGIEPVCLQETKFEVPDAAAAIAPAVQASWLIRCSLALCRRRTSPVELLRPSTKMPRTRVRASTSLAQNFGIGIPTLWRKA